MNEMENTRIIERIYELNNSHDLVTRNDLLANDIHFEAPGSIVITNRDQYNAYLQGFLDAFPDLRFELTQKVAQGDWVVVNWIASGTHSGGLRTPTGDVIPATGKKAVVPGSNTFQVKNGKVVSDHTYWDMATLLAQLGLMPGM